MMKISLYVNKDLALQSGLDEHGRQIVEVPAAELSLDERSELLHYSGSKAADYELPRSGYSVAVATPDAVRTALSALAAARAETEKKIAAEVEELVAHAVAIPIDEAITPICTERLASHENPVSLGPLSPRRTLFDPATRIQTHRARFPYRGCTGGEGVPGFSWRHSQEACKRVQADPRYVAWRQRVQERIDELNADIEQVHAEAVAEQARADEQIRRERDAAKAAREAEREAKRKALEGIVRQHGSANQQARLAEGLLSQEEMLTLFAEHVFAAASDWPLDVEPTDADVCTCEQWEDEPTYCEIDVDGGDAETLSADEFEALAKLRKLLPDCTIKAQEEVLTSQECGNTVHHRYLRAWRDDGPMMGIRDFAFPEAEEDQREE